MNNYTRWVIIISYHLILFIDMFLVGLCLRLLTLDYAWSDFVAPTFCPIFLLTGTKIFEYYERKEENSRCG